MIPLCGGIGKYGSVVRVGMVGMVGILRSAKDALLRMTELKMTEVEADN